MTEFIGISFGALEDRICAVSTSLGFSALNMDGMPTREVLAFLWAAKEVSRKKTQKVQGNKTAFVVYDGSVDFEMALRDLSKLDKNKLFGIYRQQEEKAKDTPLYDPGRGAEIVDFEGVRISQLPGKVFRMSRPKRKGMVVYDVASYFDGIEIDQAAIKYLKEAAPPKVERNLMTLWRDGLGSEIVARCESEARLVARLAGKVELTVEPLNINPRQWYGPSAIASRCLAKWGARGQAKRLTERNSAHELLAAIDRAYFGGRVEAVKLGTIQDVRILDLNSAYAYATTLLSAFYQPLRFTRQIDLSVPFSVWHCEYEIPETALLGPLPTRSPAGGISFRRRGKGYFWQPEIDCLVKHYPGAFRIKWGYVAEDAEPVKFADQIRVMYDYRLGLQAQGDEGQKIIKLALSNLYGKFAQNTGGAYYQCRAWAGWITSQVRRMLLDAVTGIEDKVICFAQDAVHLEGVEAVGVEEGIGLGQWKRSAYQNGLYLAPGIYRLSAGEAKGKTATRGSNLELDFDRIAKELSERQVSELSRAFFVGWQLSQNAEVKYGQDYLKEVSETLTLMPGRLRARNYPAQFDWLKESRNSTINTNFSGLISSRYFPQETTSALRLKLKDRGWA